MSNVLVIKPEYRTLVADPSAPDMNRARVAAALLAARTASLPTVPPDELAGLAHTMIDGQKAYRQSAERLPGAYVIE